MGAEAVAAPAAPYVAPAQGFQSFPSNVTTTAAQHRTCRAGHPLIEFSTPAPGYVCDFCKAVQPTGTVMASCRTCNFDVCPRCSGSGVMGVVPSTAGSVQQVPATAGSVQQVPATLGSFQQDMGQHMLTIEATQESLICEQLSKTHYPSPQTVMEMPQLPANGRYDELLLGRGRSRDLLVEMATIFKDEPASDCGRQAQRSGRFHNFEGTYGQKVFSPSAVVQILQLAPSFWQQSPNVQRLVVPKDGRIVIVGDTHGQLEDVLWMFFKYGTPSPSNQYVFVGDIVDRGSHALEILLLLFCFKRDQMNSVNIIRGNHEDEVANCMFGFQAELESKYGTSGGWVLHTCCKQVYPLMPIAAVVSDVAGKRSMCVVHGGIPVRAPGQSPHVTIDRTFGSIHRFVTSVQPRQTVEQEIFFNLLWADPVKPGQDPSEIKGRGTPFTEEETERFCKDNGMCALVRAHEPPADKRGYTYHHNMLCVTVFSASNYCGNVENMGGVLFCEGTKFGAKGFRPSEHYAPSHKQIFDVFRDNHPINTTEKVRLEVANAIENELRDMSRPDRITTTANTAGSDIKPVENFIIDQICLHKQKLFRAFSARDRSASGEIAKAVLFEVMGETLKEVPPLTAATWQELGQRWELGEAVPYVRFLHRFQILAECGVAEQSTHADVFVAMTRLRYELRDVQCEKLLKDLDPKQNGEVDLEEFQSFLGLQHTPETPNGIQIPPMQAAALFEAMFVALQRNPTVEDVILAVALISRSPAMSPVGSAWHDLCQDLGEKISLSGQSLVQFFRKWDLDGDGFISMPELEKALNQGVPGLAIQWSPEQLKTLMQHIDCQGEQNDRISLVEFLRATGPRRIARELTGALLGEVLKPVFFHRPALEAIFKHCDQAASGVISQEEFRAGISEMNRQLVSDGKQPLTDVQVMAVCEIASGGHRQVKYRSFLTALKAVDTNRRSQQAQSGLMSMRLALG